MSYVKGSVIQFLLSQVRTSTGSLIGGKVYFYNPGTTSTTGIEIWLDEEATSAANNPYTLDANATAQLYASGQYRIVIKDAAGVTRFDRDDIMFYDFDVPYEYDALQYGAGTFTQATIAAALTAIGISNKVTLLLRPGNWVILTALAFPANVTVDMPAGAYFSGAAVTAGTITGLKEVTPEMFYIPGATDYTVAIAAALATNANITFRQNTTYITTGGLTFSAYPAANNQQLRGNNATIKRGSGTATLLTIPIYTEIISISDLVFDQNSIGGYALVSGAHKSSFSSITVKNQGGTDYSIKISGSNLCRYEKIISNGIFFETHAVVLYGALYSEFNHTRIGGAVSPYGMRINGSAGLTFTSLLIEEAAIYINNGNTNIAFYNLSGEIASTELLIVDGATGGAIKDINVFGGKANALSDGGAVGIFRLTKASNVNISGFHIDDDFSAANRPYFLINQLTGGSIKNIDVTNGSGNSHYGILSSNTGGTRSDNMTIDNFYLSGAGTVVNLLFVGSSNISNTNVPISFRDVASSQLNTIRNSSSTVDATYSYALGLYGVTGAITDAIGATGTAGVRLGTDGLISNYNIVASTTALVLSRFDASGNVFSITGTANITSIRTADSIAGRKVTLIFRDVLTFTDGNNLNLAGNFTTSADDTITLVCDGTNWFEISRSAN